MRSKTIDRLFRRKPAASPPPPTHVGDLVVPPPPPSPSTSRGPVLLRSFISSLGPRAEASLSRAWLPAGVGGAALPAPTSWTYHLRQGHDDRQLDVIRASLVPRLPRPVAGSWTRLLLGDDFAAGAARAQSHVLRFVMPFCACISCRVAAMRGELVDDLDALIDDAAAAAASFSSNPVTPEATFPPPSPPARPAYISMNAPNEPMSGLADDSEPFETPGQTATTIGMSAARELVDVVELPSPNDLAVLGDTLASHEFELGTVSRISRRGARVTFSSFASKFLGAAVYAGPIGRVEVSRLVSQRAQEYYREHGGKSERRFYVRGALYKFTLDCTSALLYPQPSPAVAGGDTTPPLDAKRSGGPAPVGVVFRKQLMSLFVGSLALEDSFGAFIGIDQPFYIGFGQDAHGAQTILSTGSLAPARYLGVNELRNHTHIPSGHQVELSLL